MLGSELVLG